MENHVRQFLFIKNHLREFDKKAQDIKTEYDRYSLCNPELALFLQ